MDEDLTKVIVQHAQITYSDIDLCLVIYVPNRLKCVGFIARLQADINVIAATHVNGLINPNILLAQLQA